MRHRSRHAAAAAGAALFAAATLALFFVSRGKWSDAIIDSGREWIVPDALARGDLLYRDVVYWFGPFTPYFQAAVLRIFGSNLASLVLSGALASCGTLAALFLALRRVTSRAEAACVTVLAVPALIFMPNGGGPLLGMGYRIWHAATFGLLALAMACGGSTGHKKLRLAAAGGLAALSGLCRTEWGLVVLATVLLCRLRGSPRKSWVGEVGLVVGSFLLLFGGVIAFFVVVAGPDAVLRDGHVLLTGLPPETRRFLFAFSGIGDWRKGLLELLYSSGMWLGAFLTIALLSARRPGAPWRGARVGRLLALLVLLGGLALCGGAAGAVLFSAAPLVCFAALAAGLALEPGRRACALSAFGLAGLLLSYRRPFHIGDSGYVGPPLLFALVCAAGLLHLAVVTERKRIERGRLRTALTGAIVVLAALAFAGRFFQYASNDLVPVPGTNGMLSEQPAAARDLARLADMIRQRTGPEDGLVVFPEGEVLNLLSGRRNPIRHKLYIPGYLGQNEAEILKELERAPPAAVVIIRRPTSEYGPGFFGEDYGAAIRSWLNERYSLESMDKRAHAPYLWGTRRSR